MLPAQDEEAFDADDDDIDDEVLAAAITKFVLSNSLPGQNCLASIDDHTLASDYLRRSPNNG